MEPGSQLSSTYQMTFIPAWTQPRWLRQSWLYLMSSWLFHWGLTQIIYMERKGRPSFLETVFRRIRCPWPRRPLQNIPLYTSAAGLKGGIGKAVRLFLIPTGHILQSDFFMV